MPKQEVIGTINAICETCGVFQLSPRGVHMTLYDTGANGRYSFFCPRCYEQVDKPLDLTVLKVLKRLGVRFTLIAVPKEYRERKPTDEDLTVDELMDLYVGLKETDYLVGVDELAAIEAEVKLTIYPDSNAA